MRIASARDTVSSLPIGRATSGPILPTRSPKSFSTATIAIWRFDCLSRRRIGADAPKRASSPAPSLLNIPSANTPKVITPGRHPAKRRCDRRDGNFPPARGHAFAPDILVNADRRQRMPALRYVENGPGGRQQDEAAEIAAMLNICSTQK
jgi:hypothetical protein